jgi:hypothetical protein
VVTGKSPFIGGQTERENYAFQASKTKPNDVVMRSRPMSDAAARFRKQSEECRAQAAKVIRPLNKEAWLRAEEWLKAAASTEGRHWEEGLNASLFIQNQPRRPAPNNQYCGVPNNDGAKKEAAGMFADMALDISSQLSIPDWQIGFERRREVVL